MTSKPIEALNLKVGDVVSLGPVKVFGLEDIYQNTLTLKLPSGNFIEAYRSDLQPVSPPLPDGDVVERVARALNKGLTAVDDWINTYAPEFCDEARVAEARQRIQEHGTLWYLATVASELRAAITALSAPHASPEERENSL